MPTPPRDEGGRVVPHDDPESIPNESFVYRSIPSVELRRRQEGEGRYLSSGAFSPTGKRLDPYQGMSVNAGALMIARGVPETVALRPGHEALVKIRVADLREMGCQVGPDPIDPENLEHAAVWGVKDGMKKKIRRKAIWVIRPLDVVESLAD